MSANRNTKTIASDTYVCKAALVAFMRFLSVIFSNINKALVSCPCEKQEVLVRSKKQLCSVRLAYECGKTPSLLPKLETHPSSGYKVYIPYCRQDEVQCSSLHPEA